MGIGPSTKETSLHYFRDPLLNIVEKDNDLNLVGFVIFGTAPNGFEKEFISERTALWINNMDVDGVILSTDGWGSSDVDYMSLLEKIAKKRPVIGLKFIGSQVTFVVSNEYAKDVIDTNKTIQGIETEVVCQNSIDDTDVKKAIIYLKHKIKNFLKDSS